MTKWLFKLSGDKMYDRYYTADSSNMPDRDIPKNITITAINYFIQLLRRNGNLK